MTDKRTQQQADQSNTEKRPEDWTTGDEPMTGAQRSYLKTLSEEAKVKFDETLTKAQASIRIDELQRITGRGVQGKSKDEQVHESGQAEADAHGGDLQGVSDR
jgi:Protein of unknown function (DUF3072)